MKENDINKRIAQLEEHLRRNSNELNSDSIPHHSFYSYRHSNRLFTSQKGESIKSFANKIRLQKAAEYLRYSSRNIFDIALEVGYESSASFSKAFKKAYSISPTAYRTRHKETDYSKVSQTANFRYSIGHLDFANLQCEKILFDLDISAEGFYDLIKANANLSSAPAAEFMLLWDEDPYTVQADKSRCFLAIPSDAPVEPIDLPPVIEGKYAIFDTSALTNDEYEVWHKLAFLLLESDQVEMRESTYIEFYATDALEHCDSFLPNRLALAIQ